MEKNNPIQVLRRGIIKSILCLVLTVVLFVSIVFSWFTISNNAFLTDIFLDLDSEIESEIFIYRFEEDTYKGAICDPYWILGDGRDELILDSSLLYDEYLPADDPANDRKYRLIPTQFDGSGNKILQTLADDLLPGDKKTIALIINNYSKEKTNLSASFSNVYSRYADPNLHLANSGDDIKRAFIYSVRRIAYWDGMDNYQQIVGDIIDEWGYWDDSIGPNTTILNSSTGMTYYYKMGFNNPGATTFNIIRNAPVSKKGEESSTGIPSSLIIYMDIFYDGNVPDSSGLNSNNFQGQIFMLNKVRVFHG